MEKRHDVDAGTCRYNEEDDWILWVKVDWIYLLQHAALRRGLVSPIGRASGRWMGRSARSGMGDKVSDGTNDIAGRRGHGEDTRMWWDRWDT